MRYWTVAGMRYGLAALTLGCSDSPNPMSPAAGSGEAANVSYPSNYLVSGVRAENTLAYVTTDKADYLPGERVTVTGTGFLPGEAVTLSLSETPAIHELRVVQAIADENGRIVSREYLIEEHDRGQAFTLTAAGTGSGYHATEYFTDFHSGNSVSPALTAADSPVILHIGGGGFDRIRTNCYIEGPNGARFPYPSVVIHLLVLHRDGIGAESFDAFPSGGNEFVADELVAAITPGRPPGVDDVFVWAWTDCEAPHQDRVGTLTWRSSNRAPAGNAGSDETVFRGSPDGALVTLTGSGSDPDGDAIEYAWFEGTTRIGSGASASVVLPLGVHSIQLRVSDGRGGVDSDVVIITVLNQPPIVHPGASVTGREGSPVTFAATATDPDAASLSFSWDFGDGITGTGAALPTAHTYVDNGDYTVTLTADDGEGGVDVKTVGATILNVVPIVSAGDDATLTSGDTYFFRGTFTDPGLNDAPWNAQLVYGDVPDIEFAAVRPGTPIDHQRVFYKAGTFNIGLRVADKDKLGGTDVVTVTVKRLPVTVDAFPFVGELPRTVFFNAEKPALSQPVVIALLATPQFAIIDPVTKKATVALESVRLGRTPVGQLPFAPSGAPNGKYLAGPLDVNRDGRLDLVLTFQTDRLVQNGDLSPLATSPQPLALTGDHNDGRQFTAIQEILVVRHRSN